MIDNTPSIRAFVQERIKQAERDQNFAVVAELKLIVTLCDGLEKQNEILSGALGFAAAERVG